jgi:anti-sigma B factor antagonist
MPPDDERIGRSLRPRGPVTLAISRQAANGLTVLEVGGELDLLTAGKLGVEIDREVRAGGGDLLIDLRRTSFVDSAGLHVLLNSHRRLGGQGRALGVVCPPGPVRRVFELAKLIDAFGVVGSPEEHRLSAVRRAD